MKTTPPPDRPPSFPPLTFQPVPTYGYLPAEDADGDLGAIVLGKAVDHKGLEVQECKVK